MSAEEEVVELAIYPADTLDQARAFYASPRTVVAVVRLAGRDGWSGGPNMHFGHMQRGYVWTTSRLDLDEYVGLWQHEIADTHAVPREDWQHYWDWLEREGVAEASDKIEFDHHFTQTERAYASPRPGLSLIRRWGLADAETLDGAGRFAQQVGEALGAALRALAR